AFKAAVGRYLAGHPGNLAFLAMAHHRLGEQEKAWDILARLRDVMKTPYWAALNDLRTHVREAEELCVWGALSPAEAEPRLRREAAALVDGLPDALAFKDEILDHLRKLPSLDAALREHALTMAERIPDDPFRLNRASYVARLPGLEAAQYRRALRQAEAARDLAPPGLRFPPSSPPATQIGMARYRLGEYREAVDALSASEAYYHTAASSRYAAGAPWNLAFLVMAHHRLGEQETAQAI